jgi:Flp pilus assembly pilin Flp
MWRHPASDQHGRRGQGIVEYGLRPRADGSPSFASDLDGLRHGVPGQGLVEYGLILSLSALLALVLLVVFGSTMSAFLQAVGDAIDAAT